MNDIWVERSGAYRNVVKMFIKKPSVAITDSSNVLNSVAIQCQDDLQKLKHKSILVLFLQKLRTENEDIEISPVE